MFLLCYFSSMDKIRLEQKKPFDRRLTICVTHKIGKSIILRFDLDLTLTLSNFSMALRCD